MNFEAILERVAREAAKEQWPGYSHGQDVFLPRYIAVLRRELLPVLEAGQACKDEVHEVNITQGHPRNPEYTLAAEKAYDAALANLAGGEGKR